MHQPPTNLVLPGYGNSGPAHWQTLWEEDDQRFFRVVQKDWEAPRLSDWVAALESAVAARPEGVFLVAHSLACLLVAHWALTSRLVGRVKGALLVGVPDPRSEVFPDAIEGFDELPSTELPFPALAVASTDDPYASLAFVHHRAAVWGAEVRVVGPRGHLNGSSGLGSWPEGRGFLTELQGRAEGAAAVVQCQLVAFNHRDLEGWAATYADQAVQYQAPATEVARGRQAIAVRMAERFAHDGATAARLRHRTVLGTTVVDHEVVTRTYPEGVGHYGLVATYAVENGLIQTATFSFGPPVGGPEPPRPQRWAVVFTDTPGMLAIRREREPLHLAYLAQHRAEILLAGGCRPRPGEPFVGGLWILETASRERAVELIENDPYFVPSCRSYRLTTWGKALEEDVTL